MRTNSTVKHWTPDEEKMLQVLIAAGRGPDEIAVELQRSVSAIHARAHLPRLSFRRAQAKIVHARKAAKT